VRMLKGVRLTVVVVMHGGSIVVGRSAEHIGSTKTAVDVAEAWLARLVCSAGDRRRDEASLDRHAQGADECPSWWMEGLDKPRPRALLGVGSSCDQMSMGRVWRGEESG
jgi:hypothetical protein